MRDDGVARDQLSTIAKHESGRVVPPMRIWPKLPQSTWACSPGSVSMRRYALRELATRIFRTKRRTTAGPPA